MKHNFAQLLSALVFFLILIWVPAWGAVCTVSAAEMPKGSISLTLLSHEAPEHTDQPVIGAQISLYRVADAAVDVSGRLSFSVTADFRSAGLDLSDPNADGLVKDLTTYIAASACPPLDTKSTSLSGEAQFSNLSSGLYLLQMTKPDAQCHFMQEFLVSLPTQEENGTLCYHVHASPKIEVIQSTTELTVIKRWQNDLESQRPRSITVELLGDGLLADTAVLSKENGWTCTFRNLSQKTHWTVQEKEIPAGYSCTVGPPVTQNGTSTITITNTQKVPLPPLIQTGPLRWPILLLLLLGLFLLACGHLPFCRPYSGTHRFSVRSALLLFGFLLIAAGFGLCAANSFVSRSAGRASSELLLGMQQVLFQNTPKNGTISTAPPPVAPDDRQADQTLEMPTKSIQGFSCIGLLDIPALKLQLPVLSNWSYQKLKAAPCRQMGSIYSNDLVIAGHNYRTHFGRLDRLKPGDSIQLVDLNGLVHQYAVSTLQVIAPTDLDAVLDDTLDLVLYTCTYSGKKRLMVGCQRINEASSLSLYPTSQKENRLNP